MKFFLHTVFIRFLLLLVVGCATIHMNHAWSQGTNIKFRHLSIRDGLSQSSINTLFQDAEGFIWIGTQDGLNKYNGYEFLVYQNEIGDSISLTDNFVNCILEDAHHRLWIGTNAGLNIYDRTMDLFTPLKGLPAKLNGRGTISHLLQDEDDNIWITSGSYLYQYDLAFQQFNRFEVNSPNAASDQENQITAICQLDREKLLIGTNNKELLEFHIGDQQWKPFRPKEVNPAVLRLSRAGINTLYLTENKNIYIGTNDGCFIYDAILSTIKHYVPNENDPFSISGSDVTCIYEDRMDNIWIGTRTMGLNKFVPNDGKFYHYKKEVSDETSIGSNGIISIMQDHSGNLWIGTELGISKFDLLKQNFNHYHLGGGTIRSVGDNIVWSIWQDEDENIWVGTNEGLNRFDRSANQLHSFVPSITVNGEKKNNSIYAIMRGSDNTMWLGTDGGIYRFVESNESFVAYAPASAAGRSRTYTLFEDSQDRLWAGTRRGLIQLFPSTGALKVYDKASGLPDNIVRAIFEDREGDLWIGTDNGLCRMTEQSNGTFRFESFQKQQNDQFSLSDNTILSIGSDLNGYLWVGTFGGGLNRYDKENNRFFNFTEKDGLPNNVIYAILTDDDGMLWLSTNKGLCRFDPKTKTAQNFDQNDGLQSNEFNIGAYFKNPSGELFFGGIKGVNSFYPSNIRINTLPPQIAITEFRLFNKVITPGEGSVLEKSVSNLKEITLKYSQNVFSFGFAALHYSLPERNRYAYKLEGFDDNWTFDDNSRKAKYTNLDPGTYTFKVKGTNSDGIWSEELHMSVTITPPFWRILWVQLIGILIVLGSVYLFYMNRLKQVQAQKDILARQVEQRTMEVREQKEVIEQQKVLVEEEKEKLETLLLNVLPESTVEELKIKGKASARNYRKVTVMFTDFKGFTSISESLTPTELVENLDNFFVKFDEIIEKYNIEKIKTIGDAYMCAGGIPIRNKSNPIDVVLAAMEIQKVMQEFADKTPEGAPKWELRLGVHTGGIVAGVIGIKRFAYDIWGDTVNVASRVESNGEVGKVNISEATYEEINDYFDCDHRGKIHAKNKGEIDMYFVNGIKKELSVDGAGQLPNEAFWELVNLNLFSPLKFKKAESSLIKRLRKKLPDNLYYHSADHTEDVCNAVQRIAVREGVTNEDLLLLKAAALYHDAGFMTKYQNNEIVGADMAKKELPKYGFSDEQIETVTQLIMVTFASRKPESLLEKILCDADLDYLGRDDFFEVSERLKQELTERGMVRSDMHWDELQVKFLESHQYYTESSKKLREASKKKNLEKVKARMQQNEENKKLIK